MADDPAPFTDWLGRERDDDRLVAPESVRDVVRSVFWKQGYLLLGLVVSALAASYVAGVGALVVWGGLVALLALAVAIGGALAFDDRPVILAAVAAAVGVVAGLWWAEPIRPGVLAVVTVATLGFGAIVVSVVYRTTAAS